MCDKLYGERGHKEEKRAEKMEADLLQHNPVLPLPCYLLHP